jgi:hypothetical protein
MPNLEKIDSILKKYADLHYKMPIPLSNQIEDIVGEILDDL